MLSKAPLRRSATSSTITHQRVRPHMRRRQELKGVACDFIGSFLSRNNDVCGYWGIGKLYREAINRCASSVAIDLLGFSIPPNWPVFQSIRAQYTQRLTHIASKAAVQRSEAQIIVEFGTLGSCATPRWDSNHSYGDPFVCTVSLVDSKGRTYNAVRAGFCAPHDPTKEGRSNRTSAA
jgi:hypothetical protein